tara:strand:+ start:4408 stop:4671 length:264 start_codon:yes stop_codon:yes gene_type:complete
VGNTQATKIEIFSTRGGQLWIAVMEKTTIKAVENRKTLKVKRSCQANTTLDVGSLEFRSMGLYTKIRKDSTLPIWLANLSIHGISQE